VQHKGDGITASHLWSQRPVSAARTAMGSHTSGKAPTSVIVAIAGATASAMLMLSRRGNYVSRSAANGAGDGWFYDLDDTNGALYYVSEAGSTKAWSVQVVGAAVVVTSLSAGGGGGGGSYGWVG